MADEPRPDPSVVRKDAVQIARVLNNNAVLAVRDDGLRVVLMGKGIGFGTSLGDVVPPENIQHVFVPDDVHPLGNLTPLVSELPIEVMSVADAIVQRFHEHTTTRVGQSLLLALADHLAMAIKRPAASSFMTHPLAWEIAQLFPDELATARGALHLVRDRLGVQLPDSEAYALALHFVNAQFSTDDMARTEQVTRRINQVLDVVASALATAFEPSSMSVTRFVTHLRYLFVRLDQDAQIGDGSPLLREAIAAAHPDAHRAAQRVQLVIEADGRPLTDDELSYLTLHIARLEQQR